MRDGKKKKFTITIGEQPMILASKAQFNGDESLQKMGLTLQDLTEELANQFGYSEDQGVLIADVEPDSPAEQAGLKPGQLIEEVNKNAGPQPEGAEKGAGANQRTATRSCSGFGPENTASTLSSGLNSNLIADNAD